MKILLLGSNGQLGWELQRTCPTNIILTTCDYPKVDFCSTQSIAQCIKATQPDCIINTAAYTAVDKAEQEKDLAFRINHQAVIEIANLCKQNNITLVHISTDFIFDGQNHKPYQPQDAPNPKSVYGQSKLQGETGCPHNLKQKSLNH
ncbi:MAG: sugar nucleotide-binding protein [Desulfobacula sp.]|nr:sugar nucleotide-binding protein [Desulfobacula sp.]